MSYPLNTLPLIHQYLDELAGRNPAYVAARDRAKSLAFEAGHAGLADHKVARHVLEVVPEEAAGLSESALRREIDTNLSATLVGLIGGDADWHRELSELQQAVAAAGGGEAAEGDR